MLSSMTPVIVLKDGKPVLVTGSPGGRTIINTVLCVIVNVIDFEMPVQEAVAAPRLHHQWFPDEVKFEGVKQYPKLVASLKEMGHTVAQAPPGRRAHDLDRPEDGRAGRSGGQATRWKGIRRLTAPAVT